MVFNIDKSTKGKIFILDDSIAFTRLMARNVEKKLGLETVLAFGFEEARKLLEVERDNIFMAILDLNLPDSNGSEHIDYFLSKKIPSIVLTGEFSDEIRDSIFASKSIIDYALKSRKEDIDYVLSLIVRLQKNSRTKVIVTDDSQLYRKLLIDLLEMHMFTVFEAKNGKECLQLLEENPDVKLILTDYNMPEMDGFQLTIHVREKYNRDQLAIVAISSSDTKNISSRFIKIGVNDYIGKPFSKEEFFCRVNMNMDVLENFEQMRYLANNDYLTGIMNRRHFFETVENLFKRDEVYGIAQLDIDFFKKINDTYGHDAGDIAIKTLADSIKDFLGNDGFVARFGGEEFAVVTSSVPKDDLKEYFEKLRKKIEENVIRFQDQELRYTISIGVFVRENKEGIQECLHFADLMLYKSKNEGRNKVSFHEK
ncbi:MAG: diguanylate cyclase [Leptospiraceae bacterium]|nr:diguanylate cyclase [Leptospiraceae bacterium]MCP5510531.1 diguanylate cyclase [Leptospiraceae bacterium]